MSEARKFSPVSIDGFVIDAALSESHDYESEVTDYPIERGANVIDHVRNRPLTVSLECVVSDTPLPLIASQRDTSEAPSVAAMAKLEAIRDAREPIKIVTGLRTYENMIMVSLSVPVDVETGDALRFRASFRQVSIIENRRVTVRVAAPRGQAKRNLGAKPSAAIDVRNEATTPTVDDVNKQVETSVRTWVKDNRSWAKQIKDEVVN